MSELMEVDRFQRLFRETADLEADKSDVRRVNELLNRKLHALLLAGQGRARAEGRDVIMAGDIPITDCRSACNSSRGRRRKSIWRRSSTS